MDKPKRRLIIFLILFALLTVVLTILFQPLFKDLQTPEFREMFTEWITSIGIIGILVLMGIQFLQVVVAVIPGGPVQIIAGAAYGTWGGIIILMTGCAIATTFVFLIVRKFGQPLLIRFFGADAIDSWKFLRNEKKTALITFIIFLIPGTPKDTLTYLAPLSRINLLQFTLISVLARFPGILMSTIMGDAAIHGKLVTFIIVFALTAIIGILGIQFKDKIIGKLSKKQKPE